MYTKPIGFWGLVVEPGKMYSQEVPVSFKMTMATLGPEAYESSSSSKVASEPVKKAGRTIVMMTHDKDGEFALCSLHPDKHDQQSLDFVFMQGEMIHLRVMGDDAVHLSGYYFDEIESNPLLGGYDAEELEAELNGEDIGSEEEEDDDDESDEESDSEDGHEECGEECDSEMDDFINDDDIEEEEELDSKVKARNLKMTKTRKNPRVIEVASSEDEDEGDEDEEDEDEDEEDEDDNEDQDEEDEDEDEEDEDEDEDEEDEDEDEDETVNNKEHHKRHHRRLEKLASVPLTESEDNDDSEEDDDLEDDEEIDSDEAGSDLDSENDDEEEVPILVRKGSEKKRHVIPVEEPAKKAKTQAEPVPVKKAESPKQAIATSSKTSSPIASKENTPSKGNETLFVKTLPNGLKIEDTHIGQGIKAQKGRQCTIHYTIANEKGKVLSSTQGKEALSFVMGDSAKLQKALGMGIQGMALGGERKLTIPSEIVQEGIQPALPKSGTCTVTVKLENCQSIAKTA